ncbi:MAG: FapA family protein, partial [Proteobacteria bacterium]|nr:FapA family protein [Pseudomonadota bacterium]
MTDTINASPSLKRVSNERCRDKAALLENNLFNLITKQNDPIRCRFQINRDKYPDAAIVKALLQLFQRIKIPVAGLFPLLRKLLTRAIPENKQLRVKKPLSDFSETTDPDMRRICPSMEIRLSRNRLVMEIKGTPPIPSRNGAIGKAFLPPESSPGLLDQNGAIDFKETNKYPIVQTGDNLFFITPAFQGRPGIAYDGSILEVGEALPFDIELKGGVDHVESLDSEGNSIGYFLRAAKTGVAVLIRTDGKITSLEITDKLKIKRLDYSTGNIGSTVICPISIKLDTICNGFNVRTKGTVDVKILDGGGVETESHATIHTIMPGSKVVARKNINLKFSRKAELISKNGTISIKEELVDSTLFSHDILFETSKGIMTGTTLDASTLSLKKLYLYGRNTIYLGRRLFA